MKHVLFTGFAVMAIKLLFFGEAEETAGEETIDPA